MIRCDARLPPRRAKLPAHGNREYARLLRVIRRR